MNEPFPDLEIYLKGVSPEMALVWLQTHFKLLDLNKDKNSHYCSLNSDQNSSSDQSNMECLINAKAAKGGFISLWFKQNKTQWPTDKDCAEVAFDYFIEQDDQIEVRCSTGGWEGQDDGGWFRFTKEGQHQVNWL
ncbi:MAG: hypothetical protein KUG79_06440 [Pseudomonadales bacterium]|nr:hypothetical protein [Pseudomonadales bacterium]